MIRLVEETHLRNYDRMAGNNTLELCQSALEQAVEYYLNEKVMKSPVSVTDVQANKVNSSVTYEVRIRAATPPPLDFCEICESSIGEGGDSMCEPSSRCFHGVE